jgi:hypothetical protein
MFDSTTQQLRARNALGSGKKDEGRTSERKKEKGRIRN